MIKELLNDFVKEFTLDGQKWNSVEEYVTYKSRVHTTILQELGLTDNLKYYNELLILPLFAKFSQNEDLKKILLDTPETYETLLTYGVNLFIVKNCIKKFSNFNLKEISKFSSDLINLILKFHKNKNDQSRRIRENRKKIR